MLTTPNLGLKKPEGTENVDIDIINGNMDTLDGAVAAKETPAGAQAKVDVHANRKDNPHVVTAAQIGAATAQYVDNRTPKITVSATAPASPAINDIWIQI